MEELPPDKKAESRQVNLTDLHDVLNLSEVSYLRMNNGLGYVSKFYTARRMKEQFIYSVSLLQYLQTLIRHTRTYEQTLTRIAHVIRT